VLSSAGTERRSIVTNLIRLPAFAWEEPRELELPVADNWQIEVCNFAGYDRPALNNEQIKASVTNLIDSPPIRELARGKNDVVIISDDMTRVTRVSRIVPFILEELAEAGIPDERISFVIALGGHAPLERPNLIKKLGEETVTRYRVYSHNVWDFCTDVGTTSHGTKVSINSEVMRCDFKIVIGSVVPHGLATFSGGGKKILPGVSSAETIIANHTLPHNSDYETNQLRLDMEEAAKMVGIDVIVESILNTWGDSVAVYAGTEEAAHAACVQDARTNYLTTRAEDKDIVIANTYGMSNEATKASICVPSVKRSGGDLVVIANDSRGQVSHYLMGWWGRNIGGKLKPKTRVPRHINRFIIYTEYPCRADLEWFEDSPNVMLLSKWDDVLQVLKDAHGDNASVAVYPNCEFIYFG